MAYPTAVNSQITDAVTQANISVVAQSPAVAMSTIYQAMAHSVAVLFANAVAQQQMGAVAAQAIASAEVAESEGD